MRPSLFLAVLYFTLFSAFAQDGIYADFTTSLGNFTCKLHYDRAPKTVANFMALTTGERAWLDLATGEAKRSPFYDGLTFHRVVSGFVIQGGSSKGDGSDGPGYTFQDEFEPTLRHNKAGILSMANSGPNSNGSQFFITLAATSFLDDVHSVFGEVTEGLSVVQTIGNVAVGANDKPVTPVLMQNVTIRRVGAAAQAFSLSAQGLPSVGGAGPQFTRAGAISSLQFPRALYSEYTLFDSGDLATWTKSRIGLYVTPPPSSNFDVTSSAVGSAHFYRVAQVAYPGPLLTPPSVAGGTFQLTFTSGVSGSLTLNFNDSGGGTMTVGPDTGPIAYTWTQEAYRGQLFCQSTLLVPLRASHVYTSAAGGFFKGSFLTNPPTPVGGTFTHTVAAPLVANASSVQSATSSRPSGSKARAKTVKASRSKR